jgi:phosphate transport system protein
VSSLLEGHTVRRFDGELNQIHLLVLELGGLAVDQCRIALEALKSDDAAAASRVLVREEEVDALQIALDARILSLIGRRAPVARDLRAVLAFAKTVTELERMGDAAAKLAHFINDSHERRSRPLAPLMVHDVLTMGQLSLQMANDALAALDSLDAFEAERVLATHPELDQAFRGGVRSVSTFVLEAPRLVGNAVSAVLLVKAMERVGDHARNVARHVLQFVRSEDST